MLNLPRRTVFVYYEDGTRINAAMSDTLSKEESEMFQKEWDGYRYYGKVEKVTLEQKSGKDWQVIKEY